MFKFSGKLKLFSIIMLILGVIGIVYGFIATPSSADEAKEVIAAHQKKAAGENPEEHTKFVDEIHEKGYAEEAMEKAQESDKAAEGDLVSKTLRQLQARPWAAIF